MELEVRERRIIELVPPGKTVLNCGAAANPRLHRALAEKSKVLIGIDIDAGAVSVLKAEGHDVRVMNAEKLSFPSPFDVIVAGELLEHLSNPGLFVEGAIRHLDKRGMIILSTPNLDSLFLVFLVLLANQTQDPTHVAYYDDKTLVSFLSRYPGVRVCREYIPPTVKRLGRGISGMVFLIATCFANILYRISPRLGASYVLVTVERCPDE